MSGDRGPAVAAWLLATLLVAGGVLLVYHLTTRTGDLAGRTDPAALYDDPTLLFTDPGLLGTAVEMHVTEAVRACMREAGFVYRGPAVVEKLGTVLDPTADGYGIAAGPSTERPHLGLGGPPAQQADAYEAALYGIGLAGTEAPAGGCAAAGRAALDEALGSIAALPYSIEQLEADALAHPTYVAALARWSDCMTAGGFPASDPEELVAAQAAALAAASGEQALALAERERQIATTDFACRAATLDRAVEQVAADLAPVFVDANRSQLEALIPAPDRLPTPGDGSGTGDGLGTGDVQVTLRWWSVVDLDLSVTDPAGQTISYSQPAAASGGQLDRDANYPCDTATASPVENVFWPAGGAPAGAYRVTVTYRVGCGDRGPQAYELTVRLDGETVEHVRSTIAPGREISLDLAYRSP